RPDVEGEYKVLDFEALDIDAVYAAAKDARWPAGTILIAYRKKGGGGGGGGPGPVGSPGLGGVRQKRTISVSLSQGDQYGQASLALPNTVLAMALSYRPVKLDVSMDVPDVRNKRDVVRIIAEELNVTQVSVAPV